MTLENSLTKQPRSQSAGLKSWLQHPVALFLLLFMIRMVTTLPVLKLLTGLGMETLPAKMLSQLPTVLAIAGLTAWFGWWKQIGLTRTRWWSRPADLVVLALPSLAPLSALVFMETQFAAVDLIPVLLADALLVAIWEELFFRGLLLESIRTRYPRYAVLIAAVIFGLAHSTNVMAGASLPFAIVQTVWAFLGAFGYTALRLSTGSLVPLIISHFVVDGLERLLANGQAMDAPAPVLATMLVLSLVWAAYGYRVMRTGFRGNPAKSR